MTTIMDTSLTPGSLAALNATTRASGKASLDQNDFLKLLTTQLQTQDPFAPMDTQSMMTQMSQLSTSSGIAEMNNSLKQITEKLGLLSVQAGASSGWIGHDALVAGEFVNRSTDGSFKGQATLDGPATSVTIDLLDTNGLILNTTTAVGPTSGPVSFEWDGNTAGGPAAGPLKVRVIGRSGDQPVTANTSVWTPVTALEAPAGAAPQLITPNGKFAPASALALA